MSNHTLTTFRYSAEQSRFLQKSTERVLGPREVLIKTTHSGLCYTDVHAKEKGCGLGHEGVGSVQEIGSAVTNLAAGDRVGWGWLHSSCGHCPTCLSGYRQYCSEASGFAYSDLDQGAFGDSRIIDAEFAYKIPDAISSVDAGPLMCAGASVYEALDAAGTKPSDRVGVVGVGGLGHMAVLFARAMGCGVTSLFASKRTPSPQKVQDAFALGADDARCISEHDMVYQRDEDGGTGDVAEATHKPINVLLVTSNELPDWNKVLPLLDRMARIVLMSIQLEPLSIPYMPFILPGHRIIASTEASKRNHVEMLQFAARNQVRPWVEVFPMTESGLKKAFDRLESGQMRYRGVLEW
ncbi:Alcohol dehydrogenase [Cytospora mali]|uniref:Alcohol dehydrogenase n=1 Tax=Cytospora mali TaxID=578113 RepID=A0A194WA06_CYTMA|nr:Alcohol dehydrogenase [Valsa mali]